VRLDKAPVHRVTHHARLKVKPIHLSTHHQGVHTHRHMVKHAHKHIAHHHHLHKRLANHSHAHKFQKKEIAVAKLTPPLLPSVVVYPLPPSQTPVLPLSQTPIHDVVQASAHAPNNVVASRVNSFADSSKLDIKGPCADPHTYCAERVVFDENGDAVKVVLEPQATHQSTHFEVQRPASAWKEAARNINVAQMDPDKAQVSLVVPFVNGSAEAGIAEQS
jgi:hypothetical protein